MPNASDLNELPLMIHAVDDPIRSDDDLAYVRHLVLKNHPTNLGKVLQLVGLCDEAIAKGLSPITTVAGNEGYNVAEVVA